jgi:hypothetical protein
VPRYLKFFEAVFFVTFLGLYYAVLVPVQRNGRTPIQPPNPPMRVTPSHNFFGGVGYAPKSFHKITTAEILLYVWIAGFAYDESQ